MKYSFVNGARPRGLKPETAAAEFNRIADAGDGSLTAEAIVTAAADEGNALHAYFDWDNAVAGHQHRLTQARCLIRYVVVELDEAPEVGPVREWLHVEARSAYMRTRDIARDAPVLKTKLEEALDALKNWRKTYAQLSQLGRIFSVVDEEVPELEKTVAA